MNESASSNITVGAETLRDLYVTMRRIRAFEDKTADLFQEGVVKGTAHSYKGEEAIAAGVCATLRDDDIIASYHRGHGHCIAKGARIDRMMAELMGRQTGYCQGLGGSMHIADMELNIMGANGIVGAAMPLATGAGLAAKLQGTDQVAVAFFGDGASNQGVFHESLNLAAVWKLPVIFVCENNQYALSTSYRNTTAVAQVSNRAASYEIPGITVDGNDGVEVYLVLREAVDRARAGEGPTLIEAMTYRHGQHSLRVNLRDPRPEDEIQFWMDRDPIARMEKRLTTEGGFSDEQFERDHAGRGRRDRDRRHLRPREPGAAGAGDARCRLRPPRGAHRAGARYRAHALLPRGAQRGAGSGDAARRPGLPHGRGCGRDRRHLRRLQGADGALRAGARARHADLGGHLRRLRRRRRDRRHAPGRRNPDLRLRGAHHGHAGQPGGQVPLHAGRQAQRPRWWCAGPRAAASASRPQHSQSLEAWFTHVPGLVVAAPATPYEAKGLLVAAIRDNNPVIFLEQKLLYLGGTGPVPEELYAIPLGKADVKREGTDVTVVATLAMVPRALSAATVLERDGISVEVVDPRTLQPLDEETILSSVRKTNRLLIVHEAWVRGGFGAEVSAMVVDKGLRLSRRPHRPLGRPAHADALQRPPRARGHPLPGAHSGGDPRAAVAPPPPHRGRVRRPVSSCPDLFRASTRPPTLARTSRVMPGPARTRSGYPGTRPYPSAGRDGGPWMPGTSPGMTA